MFYLGFLVLASIGLIVYALWPKEGDQEDAAIKRRMTGKRAQNAVSDVRKQAKESVAKKMVDAVAPIAIRPSMVSNPEDMSKLRVKLSMAGFRTETAPTTFLASKSVVAVLFAIAALGYAWMKGETFINGAGYTLLGAGCGFLAPDLWLGSAMSKRQELVRRGLPDTLDLLVITVESGLGLDAAFQRVGDEMKLI
jgi:tight adherence protein C